MVSNGNIAGTHPLEVWRTPIRIPSCDILTALAELPITQLICSRTPNLNARVAPNQLSRSPLRPLVRPQQARRTQFTSRRHFPPMISPLLVTLVKVFSVFLDMSPSVFLWILYFGVFLFMDLF